MVVKLCDVKIFYKNWNMWKANVSHLYRLYYKKKNNAKAKHKELGDLFF